MSNLPPQIVPPYSPPPPRRGIPPVAIVVITIGVCGFCMIPILAAILFPAFGSARAAAKRVTCLSNVKLQGLGMLVYSNDNDSRLPPSVAWMDTIQPDIHMTQERSVFRCPMVLEGEFGYGMNRALTTKDTRKIADPEATVLIFESRDTSRNATGDPTKDVAAPRHGLMNCTGYVDGHAKARRVSAMPSTL